MYISICMSCELFPVTICIDRIYFLDPIALRSVLHMSFPSSSTNLNVSPNSVRSTNVYEEQSLGIFKDDEEPENEFEPSGPSRMHVWSRYLAMHARRQLAFGMLRRHHQDKVYQQLLDLWWLCVAVFLICIIEVCICASV